MNYEGRYLCVAVLPSGNVQRDAGISEPGTLFDLNGRLIRVDRSYSNRPRVTKDGQYIQNFIHLEQDTAL